MPRTAEDVKRYPQPGDVAKCELCNGNGWRLVAWPFGSVPVMTTCCDCEGSGKLNSDWSAYAEVITIAGGAE